jgi:hydroxymethylpyrimidine pyrophosphatase-like HAD family hydrolase
MRYLVLACDYDGTLASGGHVGGATLAALDRLRASGRRPVLVTGRLLDDLLGIFPQVALFDWLVTENGALLYQPETRRKLRVGSPPLPAFVDALRERGVAPLSVGEVIVSTEHPHETAVLDAIRDLGLEMQIVFNKGAVMVLPAGSNKATGLAVALREMGISPHNAVAVGDAENDHALFNLCECAVAVADALPVVREHADFVTSGGNGTGVIELIEEIIADDLRGREDRLTRHHIFIGTDEHGNEKSIPPYGLNLLLAGSSGSGKSTFATAIMERLRERVYQFCVVDPEGDYETLEWAVALGTHDRPPSVEEVLHLLKNPEENAVANLVGLPLGDRPRFFSALMPHLVEMRARLGRPHWIVVDEAHHMLSASSEPGRQVLPKELDRMLFITVHPKSLAPAVLSAVDVVLAVGDSAGDTLREVADSLGQEPPPVSGAKLGPGEVLMWWRKKSEGAIRLRTVRSRSERRRHRRKYAEGDLGPERSFYFQGPHGKLNLRAQNLTLFMQMADGVDDDTWSHHLRRGDYSRWFRDMIKDESLADEARCIEAAEDLSLNESRARIKAAIRDRYTLPS